MHQIRKMVLNEGTVSKYSRIIHTIIQIMSSK